MTSSETRLHSGEGTVGFEMVIDLFVDFAFEDLRQAGQDGYRSVKVWVQGVSHFEEGDDRGSFPILGDLRRYEKEVEQAGNRGCDNGGGQFQKQRVQIQGGYS